MFSCMYVCIHIYTYIYIYILIRIHTVRTHAHTDHGHGSRLSDCVSLSHIHVVMHVPIYSCNNARTYIRTCNTGLWQQCVAKSASYAYAHIAHVCTCSESVMTNVMSATLLFVV